MPVVISTACRQTSGERKTRGLSCTYGHDPFLHDGIRIAFKSGVAAFVGNHQWQVVYADAALDFKSHVRLRQLEVVVDVLEKIRETPHAGGGQHAHQRRERFLIGKGARFKAQRVDAVVHRRAVMKGRPVHDREPHALRGSRAGGIAHCCCCCCSAMRRARRMSGTPPPGKPEYAPA